MKLASTLVTMTLLFGVYGEAAEPSVPKNCGEVLAQLADDDLASLGQYLWTSLAQGETGSVGIMTRLPQDLKDRLQRLSRQHGITEASVFRAALDLSLGILERVPRPIRIAEDSAIPTNSIAAEYLAERLSLSVAHARRSEEKVVVFLRIPTPLKTLFTQISERFHCSMNSVIEESIKLGLKVLNGGSSESHEALTAQLESITSTASDARATATHGVTARISPSLKEQIYSAKGWKVSEQAFVTGLLNYAATLNLGSNPVQTPGE